MLIIAILIGLITAFNFLILRWKWQRGQYANLVMDVGSLVVLSALFGNTILGMLIAMVASMVISLFLTQ